jgi:hypothetical protein
LSNEDRPLVAGLPSTLLWVLLVAASALLVVAEGSVEGYIVFGAVAGVVLVSTLYYRLHSFSGNVSSLLDTGLAMRPFDYSSQSRRSKYLILGTLVLFILPFGLAGILDTPSWLGSIVGAVDGWVASLLAYNGFLRTWQARHGGRLLKSYQWRGTKVTHTGLKFMKEGQQT